MNYIQHNKELDGALYKPENPVIFTKCDSALLKDRKPFFIPDWSKQVDYETEVWNPCACRTFWSTEASSMMSLWLDTKR